MRAVALHPDVVVATSALLQLNCVIVRGQGAAELDAEPAHGGPPAPDAESPEGRGAPAPDAGSPEGSGGRAPGGETFVIDSPVLPSELDALPSLVEQARFPAPSGLLATHGDWDHLLGRLAFPSAALGCAPSTAARLRAEPGAAQRELRAFDEELYIDRGRPLSLGSVQALEVPGRCGIGALELELHPTEGHTSDGMAVWIDWASVLVVGDYLSPLEIPTLNPGGGVQEYLTTLQRLRPLVRRAEHVVPGHGPVSDRSAALRVLEEDLAYLRALGDVGPAAALPGGRRSHSQRELHSENLKVMR